MVKEHNIKIQGYTKDKSVFGYHKSKVLAIKRPKIVSDFH